MRKLAAIIRRTPGAKVVIEGHADSRGDTEHNQTLSERRAKAVGRWLLDHNVVAAVSVRFQGFGDGKPLVLGQSLDALRANRRVDVTLDCSGVHR